MAWRSIAEMAGHGRLEPSEELVGLPQARAWALISPPGSIQRIATADKRQGMRCAAVAGAAALLDQVRADC
jgi:hypothetical protein